MASQVPAASVHLENVWVVAKTNITLNTGFAHVHNLHTPTASLRSRESTRD